MSKSFPNPKSNRFIISFIIIHIILLLAIPRFIHSQSEGYKYYRNYSNKDYNHKPQNWAMAQAASGLLYVANQGGVLEYDGSSWRLITWGNYAQTRSLAVDDSGTIYVGGSNDFGYLKPDEKGTLKYNSLLKYVEEKYRNFSTVWNTYATKDGIYFRTNKYLFHWDSNKINVLDPKFGIYGFYYCNKELFVLLENLGLVKLDKDSFQPIPGGKKLDYVSRIFMIVPYDARRMLIGATSTNRSFFIYDGKKIEPFHVESQKYINHLGGYHGIRLTSGDYAVATKHGGLVILGPNGKLKKTFDSSYGLQHDNVHYVFQDKQENLWLCLDKGISKIEYVSPLTVHDKRSGLPGIVMAACQYNGDLYAGTISGIFYLETPLHFRRVASGNGSCGDLKTLDDGILAATTDGVFHIIKDKSKLVTQKPAYSLAVSKHHPGRIWCGTSDGLLALDNQNSPQAIKQVLKKTKKIDKIVEDPTGSLWLVMDSNTISKVDFPESISESKITYFNDSHGLPEGELDVAWVAGHLMVATTKGIYRFDKDSKIFIPDQTLGPDFSDGSKPVFRISEDKEKNIWLHSMSKNYKAIPGKAGAYRILSEPFRRIPISAQVNHFYFDLLKNVTWFATDDGLIRYDDAIKKKYTKNFPTHIRKIVINDEIIIFDGYKEKLLESDSKKLRSIFSYDERNIIFEFAAPFFEAESDLQYQFVLEGYSKGWSDWEKKAEARFSSLPSGDYTFRVRAKNIYDLQSSESAYSFSIKPPWHLTWWAFILYTFLVFIISYFGYKWRRAVKLEKEKKRLEEDKRRLEDTVAKRTQQIREQNTILEERNNQIRDKNTQLEERSQQIKEKNQQLEGQTKQLKEQSDKLEELNQMKSRFFANISHEFRTPLTLIMSPLGEMLDKSKDPGQKEELNLMLRSSRRLLTLINQLLDLSRFDGGKMKLQAARQDIVMFLKGITASFHVLVKQAQLKLEFHSEAEEIFLYFDQQKMEEAIVNLLINAVKFTPPGGKIKVSVAVETVNEEKKLMISIKDTGIGISNEQMTHIFDRFYQAEGLKEKSHKGTGIGLALAKDIIEMHLGIINVHSRIDEGTEFVIRLPMGREHLKDALITNPPIVAPEQIKPIDIEARYIIPQGEDEDAIDGGNERPQIDDVAEDNVLLGNEGEEKSEKEDVAKAQQEEQKTILVVEDDPDVRKYIRGPLQKEYKVLEAADGRKGLEKAKEFMPDLIVSDIMMPGLNGLELCKKLRENIETSHIPIILLTAKATDENVVEGFETGADDYITKPFNTKILLTRIKNLIDLRLQFQKKIQRQKMLMPDKISITSLDKQFFAKFQAIVGKNFTDPDFTIDVLCEKLDMGRSTLFKKIKALSGETPNQFILSYRLERGAQLLKQKYGNVTDVAMKVGFSSPAYFTKCFGDKFHISPSEYMAIHSNIS